MVIQCSKCGTEIRPNERACTGCGKDAGFPNVRSAVAPGEQAALDARYKLAQVSAVARGVTIELDAFVREVGTSSRAIMNRPLGALNSWVEGTNPLFLAFHSQVEVMGRPVNDTNYDQQRVAAEAAVNPFCYEMINFAALTLDETGLVNYGPYSVLLKDISIDERSSVFEENPFEFNKRHHVVAGQLPPLGFRASWTDRGKLAGTKLEPKLERGMLSSDFPPVLMEDRGAASDCDYVEVHIYGPINRLSIEKVIGPKPAKRVDVSLWHRTVGALKKLGATVEETP